MRRVLLIASAVALGACATYSERIRQMERALAGGSPGVALKALEASGGSRKDVVIYLLNKAMILRMQGEYDASTASFERAKTLMDKFATVSVSEQAGALAFSENVRAYAGEPYERVLVHVFEALNYLQTGALQEARVEAMQLDKTLQSFKADQPTGAGFARYVAGLIFESLQEWDDALIDYRKSLQAYERSQMHVPPLLARDLLRLTARLRLADEHAMYRKRFPAQSASMGDEARSGELVFFLLSGLAPLKKDIVTPVLVGDKRLITVALPYLAQREPEVTGATLQAGHRQAQAALYADMNHLAGEALARKMPLLISRAVVRAAIKNEAVKKAEEKGNRLLGLVVNSAGVAIERADTRSWSTLPNRVYIARLPLDPGAYTPRVRLAGGGWIRELETVSLREGEKRFFSLHWVTPQDLAVITPRPAAPIDMRVEMQRRRH